VKSSQRDKEAEKRNRKNQKEKKREEKLLNTLEFNKSKSGLEGGP